MTDASDAPSDDLDKVEATDLAGAVREFTTPGWPEGYVYGATRYADVILRESFPDRFNDLVSALTAYRPTLTEL